MKEQNVVGSERGEPRKDLPEKTIPFFVEEIRKKGQESPEEKEESLDIGSSVEELIKSIDTRLKVGKPYEFDEKGLAQSLFLIDTLSKSVNEAKGSGDVEKEKFLRRQVNELYSMLMGARSALRESMRNRIKSKEKDYKKQHGISEDEKLEDEVIEELIEEYIGEKLGDYESRLANEDFEDEKDKKRIEGNIRFLKKRRKSKDITLYLQKEMDDRIPLE